MDVFLTGGTRVLGLPVVQLLRRAGHRVRALARDERGDAALRGAGAEPVHVDLFDPDGLRQAVAGSQAVLHLATRIPLSSRAGRPGAWAENDRLRTQGTRNLVDAALAAGASVVLYPSVVFVYPDRGAEWIDPATPPDPPQIVRSTLDAEREVARFTEAGGRGIVLRMGVFYGPACPTTLEQLALARRGLALTVGPGGAYQSSIWVDDAAAAVVAALQRAPAGVYDAVDDEPLTRRDLATALGPAAGRRRLVRVPWPVVRLAGGVGARAIGRSLRVSNRRLKEATDWSPEVSSAREGYRRLAAGVIR